jgi:kynurenine formamidase
MKVPEVSLLALVLVVAAALATSRSAGADFQAGPDTHQVTKADIDRWEKELSNWGRWGKDDQIGAINLITPAKRKQAASLVKDGFSVSLSREMDTEKTIENTNPLEHTMLGIGSDRLAISFHGYSHSHLDSLAHVSDNGVFYNGYTPDKEAIMKENGHSRNSIFNLRNGIFTRGVLIDIARLKGVEYLEPGTRIYPEDLEAWEKKAGIKVSAGDALFIRTGRWVRRAKLGPWDIRQSAAGLDASVIPWLKQRDIALLGGESPQDAAPAIGDTGNLPVHNFALVYLGVHLFDNVDLTALGEAAAARKRWDFLLTVAPWAVRGGTGSPLNPIATF